MSQSLMHRIPSVFVGGRKFPISKGASALIEIIMISLI